MARQKGLLRFKGTLDGLTFYKTKDGSLVRTKGGVEKDRIMNDPKFIRTRENMEEFSSSAASGKLLRKTTRTLMMNAKDGNVTSRLTKIMSQIKNMDTVSVRGKRNVGIGITNPNALLLLKGFDYNNLSPLSTVLFAPYVLTPATGQIDINPFTPINDVMFDNAATHISFRGAFAIIDFANNEADIQYSPIVNLPIDGTMTPVTLTPIALPVVPGGGGNKVYFLQIQFFQEVNGVQYTLKNGSYNVLNLIEIM
jgi:hypothetical protein